MELWDAYDADFNKIEGVTLIRGEEASFDDDIFHLVCDILVKHVDGTYLLMQRDMQKHFGGMWEATAGGSALQGETPIECARRELEEETGIIAELTEVGRMVDRSKHSVYVEYMCITDWNKNKIRFQKGETIAYKWVTKNELIAMKEDELVTHRIQNFLDELKKWLFFDLGSTLIDESDCIEYRILHMMKQKKAPDRAEIVKKMKECAFDGKMPYKDTAKEFGLELTQWPKHLEILYQDVPQILERLHNKYCLGIIANQSAGTEERLIKFGIRDYFKVILSSAEEGVAKPDLEIFKRALERAECMPGNAYMIGDRLDNDIQPAAKLGMSTIWVKQGYFGYTNLDRFYYKPDIMVEHIEEILKYL